MCSPLNLNRFWRSGIILVALTLASSERLLAEDKNVQVVDGAGRILQVPDKIKRVYATSPVAIVMLYSLAPERMVGWNYKLGQAERHFILPAVRDLPALGGWFGENGKGNRETLLASRPDVILSIGYNDKTSIDFADRLQQQVGIPVFVASGRMADTAETYELLGKLLGVSDRARLLADYCRSSLAEAKALAKAVPANERPRIYYAEGLRGLQTDTKGSMHTEPLDFLGIENVAQGPETSGFGRVSVSLDQVIAWKPDVVLACPEKVKPDGSWLPEWFSEPTWKAVPAVSRGRVYLIPGAPFNWFDRPPSAARMLGVKWLLWVLYPGRVKYDMVDEVRQFYRLFYWYEMDEAEARQILDASRPVFFSKEPK
jgi:iron complex transport system substrate-binding protein